MAHRIVGSYAWKTKQKKIAFRARELRSKTLAAAFDGDQRMSDVQVATMATPPEGITYTGRRSATSLAKMGITSPVVPGAVIGLAGPVIAVGRAVVAVVTRLVTKGSASIGTVDKVLKGSLITGLGRPMGSKVHQFIRLLLGGVLVDKAISEVFKYSGQSQVVKGAVYVGRQYLGVLTEMAVADLMTSMRGPQRRALRFNTAEDSGLYKFVMPR